MINQGSWINHWSWSWIVSCFWQHSTPTYTDCETHTISHFTGCSAIQVELGGKLGTNQTACLLVLPLTQFHRKGFLFYFQRVHNYLIWKCSGNIPRRQLLYSLTDIIFLQFYVKRLRNKISKWKKKSVQSKDGGWRMLHASLHKEQVSHSFPTVSVLLQRRIWLRGASSAGTFHLRAAAWLWNVGRNLGEEQQSAEKEL